MATTQNTFTGDGSNLGPFSFTFKWLESTDIKVTVAGVLKTAGTHYNLQSLNYSTKTGGQVLFTAGNAPANGATIVIYRQTDDTDLAATFYSGSAIRAQDLNNNFIQGLYVTQESSNNAAAATAAANAATTTANTALSNSTAAQASAASAISTANSAVSTANSAVSTANSAVSTANSASAAAASAVSTANTANSTASSALSAVSEALAYTTVANVAAIPGSPTNGDSLRITDSTGIESFTPLVGVPVGFVGNSALTVEIYYNGTSSTWVWSRYFPNDPENRYWTGSVIVSDTAPSGPTDDSLWYDSIGGRFYIRYNDGNTSQWVDASPQGNRTSTFQAGTAALPGLTPEGDTDTGIYSPGANQVAISTNGTGRLFVDSSGRVGVGTSSPGAPLHVSGGDDILRLTATDPYLSFYNGATRTGYIRVNATGGSFGIVSESASAMMQLYTNNNPRLNITAGGNVGIGTTSPSAIVHANSGSASDVYFRSSNSLATSSLGTAADGSTYVYNSAAYPVTFSTNATERARIDSSGRLLVGTSSRLISDERNRLSVDSGSGTFVSASFKNDAGANANTVDIWNAATSGNNNFITFFTEASSTSRGSIDYNRSAGQVRYNVTSDRRLKSEIQPAGTALTALASIQVRSYKWTETGYQVEHGFIAQELNGVVPDAVKTGDDNDEVTETWAVDNAKLVPLLTKALQEALEKIETLEAQTTSQATTIASFEARLTALEGGNN